MAQSDKLNKSLRQNLKKKNQWAELRREIEEKQTLTKMKRKSTDHKRESTLWKRQKGFSGI